MRPKDEMLREYMAVGPGTIEASRMLVVLEAVLDVRDALLVVSAAASGVPFVFGETKVEEHIIASVSNIVSKLRKDSSDQK